MFFAVFLFIYSTTHSMYFFHQFEMCAQKKKPVFSVFKGALVRNKPNYSGVCIQRVVNDESISMMTGSRGECGGVCLP